MKYFLDLEKFLAKLPYQSNHAQPVLRTTMTREVLIAYIHTLNYRIPLQHTSKYQADTSTHDTEPNDIPSFLQELTQTSIHVPRLSLRIRYTILKAYSKSRREKRRVIWLMATWQFVSQCHLLAWRRWEWTR